MSNKKPVSKLISIFMALVFMLTLLPGNALGVKAAEGDNTGSDNSGMVVNKTATLEDDGTYTINLEAYATGSTMSSTIKSGVPLDIVLVIDQSGSMAYNDNGNSTNNETNRRIYKLKNAVTSFVNNISANAKEYNVDHRIAIAGYASNKNAGPSRDITGIGYNGNGNNWVNTGLYVNGSFKNYGGNRTSSTLTNQDYKDALVSVNDADGNVASSITGAISLLKASGGTYTEYGLLMAKGVFDNNPIEANSNRKRIVVLFTDGETNSDISTVLDHANELKGSSYNSTIYTVGFGSSVKTDFLSHVSSNYTTASYNNMRYSGTQVATKYSMTANNSTELNKIFENISEDVLNPTTSVTLDAQSVMRDILADGFKLPEGYKAEDSITIQTRKGSISGDSTEITWGDEANASGITATADTETGTIDITGFNYSEKYIAKGHDGEKLLVTIKGVLATDSVITGSNVNTNKENSGIYAYDKEKGELETEPTVTFPMPTTKLTSKSYVLDYGKSVELSANDWEQSSVTSLDKDGMNQVSSSNGNLSYKDNLSMTYGTVDKKTSGNALVYQPGKINWDGFDSFYALGKTAGSSNIWSKINVIPATSVYYEDDFMVSTNSGKNTAVSIVYDGSWSTVNDDTGAGDNLQSSDNSVYGWDSSYENDTKYSNGSAHYLEGDNSSTATFTFTGTGVDIYSSTNMETGVARASIYEGTEVNTDNRLETRDMDHLWEGEGTVDGTLYQIPTLYFSNLKYGTYTVQIKVAKGETNDGETLTTRNKYYLDGIRVYNPLGDTTSGSTDTVASAYDEAYEAESFVQTVRDILLDAGNFGSIGNTQEGVVYIDKENGTTNDIGTYEEYGPKNEVYLKQNTGIAFNINQVKASKKGKVFIGLKSPTGQKATVKVTDGDNNTKTITLNSASDQYYEITPNSEGNIVIQNETTGEGNVLVSVTKVRVTHVADSVKNRIVTNASTISYLQSFDSLSSQSDEAAVAGNNDTKESAAVQSESEEETNETVSVREEGTGKVVIQQADTEESEENLTDTEDQIWGTLKTNAADWLSQK